MIEANPTQSLFHTYIIAGVQASLDRVRPADYVMPEADRQQAWHILSFALNMPEAWPVTRELLLALAPKMEQAGFREEWIPYLEKGLQCSKSKNDRFAEGELCLYVGHLYQRIGKLIEAKHFVADAVTLFQSLQNLSHQGAALNRLAEIAREERDYAQAEQFTDLALTSLTADDLEYSHTYLIKGRIAFDQAQWAMAQDHFETACHFSRLTKAKRREAVCIQNLGRIRQIKRDYPQAIHYYERSISILKEIQDSFNLAAVQMNLGVVYSLTNQPEQALQQYFLAEPIFVQMQELRHLAKLQTNRGIEWYNLKQWELSSQAFHKSAGLWKQLGDEVEYANALDGLGMVYAAQHDDQKAIQLFTQALTTLQQLNYQDTFQKMVAEITEHLQEARTRGSTGSQGVG